MIQNKFNKRIISMLLVVVMLVSMVPTSVFAENKTIQKSYPFTDIVEQAWYEKDIEYVWEHKIFYGLTDTTFGPDEALTRGMFVTVLGRIVQADIDAYTEQVFPDVDPSAWYGKYVAWASDKGIAYGMENGDFEPDSYVTRQQIAAFLYRFLMMEGIDVDGAELKYNDKNLIADYAKDAAAVCLELGFIVGDSSNTFRPNDNANRAEASAICTRLHKYLNEEGNSDVVNYYNVKIDYPVSMSAEDKDATIMPAEQIVVGGDLVYSMPTPYREGYIFNGWYYDSNLAVLAGTEDVIDKNMTLYPKMVKGDESTLLESGALNYVAALDVESSYKVKVQAPSLDAVEKGISFIAVSDGNKELEFTVTDHKDGTYTIYPKEGLEPGKTYQIIATDRETLANPDNPVPLDNEYVLFIHEDQVEPKEVRYYNIFTYREEEDQLRIDDNVQFIDFSEVSGFGMEEAAGLYSVRMSKNGDVSLLNNETEGTFIYEGTPALEVGDIVAIHRGDIDEENRVLEEDTEVAYVEITQVDGVTYSYVTAKSTDVLFLPDVIPVPVSADTDGNAEDNTITIHKDFLDFTFFEHQEALNEDTVVGPDDYIAFYEGNISNAKEVSEYAKINTIEYKDDVAVITYESTTLEELQSAIDTYTVNGVDLDLPESEIVHLENRLVEQAKESGFAEEAAAYAVQSRLGIEEDIEWGKSYMMAQSQAELCGIEVDGGNLMYQVEIGRPNVDAEIKTKLQKVTQVNNASGLRVAFGVTVPVGIEVVENGHKVIESITIDLYVTFEQEVAFSTKLSVDVQWKLAFIIPYISEVVADAKFEMGVYTGIGAIASASTGKNYKKTYLWNELVEKEDGTDIFSSASSIAEKLNKALANGDLSFFGEMDQTEGTLVEKYEEMLKREVDYFDILALPLLHKKGYFDKLHMVNYVLDIELVFAAKLNITMGISFENLNVKQYSFNFRLFDGEASHNVVDKQTPYTNFNFFIMGNLGVRAGIGVTFSVGLISTKIDNIGVHIEVGPYLELYGFYYYHFEKVGNKKPVVKSGGALYVEIGIYMVLDFFAGAFLDLLSVEVHLVDESWKIWGTDNYWYPIEPAIPEATIKQYNNDSFSLADSYFAVREFNIVTGEWRTSQRSIGDYLPAPTARTRANSEDSKITYNPKTQKFTVDAEFTDMKISEDFTFVYKNSNELLGPVTKTIHINWEKSEPKYAVQYYTGHTLTRYSNGTWLSGIPQVDDSKTVMHVAGKALPAMKNHDMKWKGFDFKGWRIDCPSQPDIHGKMLHEVNYLEGYIMPEVNIGLDPVQVARTDTPYKIRHYVESFDKIGEYELVKETTKKGRTNSAIASFDFLEDPGYQLDYSKYPIRGWIDGYPLYYSIRNDGSTVIDVYYDRADYRVGVHANNPLFDGEELSEHYYHSLKYGQQIPDPGYGDYSKFAGYCTLLGWSTTPDGPVEYKELPVADCSKDYYAVWDNESVSCEINYYVIDPASKTYKYDHAETKELLIGSAINYKSVYPNNNANIKDLYMDKIVAYYGKDDSQAYTDNFLNTKAYDNGINIHVYYTATFYQAIFGQMIEYVQYGQDVTVPEGPTKPGYTFLGWKSSYIYDRNIYQPGDVIKMKKHEFFTALYGNAEDTKYTVNHYFETEVRGTYKEPEVETLTGTTGATVKPDVKSVKGYKSPEVKSAIIEADGSTVVNYYYPLNTYVVNINLDGGRLRLSTGCSEASSYRYGVDFFLFDGDYTVTKPGYNFVGWYLSTDESQTILKDDWVVSKEVLTLDQDLTFVAKYEEKEIEYKVEHYLEKLDGSYALQQTDRMYGHINQEVTAQAVEFRGFTYHDSHKDTIASGTITSETEIITLKLYYSRNSYDAKWYNYDTSSLVTTTQFKYQEKITAPDADAVREGYKFNGWNIGNVTMPVDGISFNGKDHGNWTANTYTVVFNSNGGTGNMANQTFTYDKKAALSKVGFSREGWTFEGWNTKANGSGTAYHDQEEVQNLAATGSVTLYAQWIEIPSVVYKVEHYLEDLAGGTYTKAEDRTQNFEAAVGTTVTASSITIEGFTYDADNGNNVRSAKVTDSSTNIVLKLYYNRNSYKLTLDFAGETMKQAVLNTDTYLMDLATFEVEDKAKQILYGQNLTDALSNITVPVMVEEGYWDWNEELQEDVYVDPVYEDRAFETAFPGYVFDGWYLGETKYESTNTMPADQLTLTAKWTPIEIEITFYSGYSYGYAPGVTGTTFTETYAYGEVVKIPTNDFSWTNHSIGGWKFGNGDAGFGQYPDISGSEIPLVYGYDSNGYFADGTTAIEIYPYWIDNNHAIYVDFNGNLATNGDMEVVIIDEYSGCNLIPNKFIREGYKFIGWNTMSDGSGTDILDREWISKGTLEGFISNGRVTLYAQWEKAE